MGNSIEDEFGSDEELRASPKFQIIVDALGAGALLSELGLDIGLEEMAAIVFGSLAGAEERGEI